MLQLSNYEKMPNKIEEFLDFQGGHVELPVLLWGAGAACEYFIKFMRKYSILISGIIDKKKSVSMKDGMQMLTPEEAYAKYDSAIVVVSAIAHKNEIEKEIVHGGGYKYFVFSFDPTLEILQQKSCGERRRYFSEHEKEILDFGKALEDKQSEDVFKNVVVGALTNDTDYYKYTSSESQYFPEIVKDNLSEEETFVDLGAFIGDSIEEFISVVNNKFNKIYAFEPNPSNLNVARMNLQDVRIEFYLNGVGKEPGVFYLAGEGEATHCVAGESDAAEKVEVIKLDDVIKERVTYIKMDIEGMELDALKGAEQLIRRYKPKLAISVYHKMEDMVEIPQYIKGLNLGYRFYLRHFWNCNGTDVILFAI